MTGGGGTAGLAQIAQPPHARRSVDLNEGGAKARGGKKHRWMEKSRGTMSDGGRDASRWSQGVRRRHRETQKLHDAKEPKW